MKLYRTRRPLEPLNIKYAKKRNALRIAQNGYALYIDLEKAITFIKWSVIVTATLILFKKAQHVALDERGYIAIGGEYGILLVPYLLYVLKFIFNETVAQIRESVKRGWQ